MSFETVDFAVADGVARIRLDRPAARNAMNWQLIRDLHAAARRAAETPGVRAVLLAGKGKSFCAGGDLIEFREAEDRGQTLFDMATEMHETVRILRELPVPVVAGIQGFAFGAGLSLALLADVRVAAQSAQFNSGFVTVGLTNDTGSTYLLPRLIGWARASDLMLTGRTIDADTALEWGLVTRVVKDDALAGTALELAAELARGPTQALGAIKDLLNRSAANDLVTQLRLEQHGISRSSRSADADEAFRAFQEKRPPEFSGR